MVLLVINAYHAEAVHSAYIVDENSYAVFAAAAHTANMISEKTDATTAAVLPFVNRHGAKLE